MRGWTILAKLPPGPVHVKSEYEVLDPVKLPVSNWLIEAWLYNCLRVDLIDAILPFSLAEFRDATTTADSIPMIAMTTRSSIKVNPVVNFDDLKV